MEKFQKFVKLWNWTKEGVPNMENRETRRNHNKEVKIERCWFEINLEMNNGKSWSDTHGVEIYKRLHCTSCHMRKDVFTHQRSFLIYDDIGLMKYVQYLKYLGLNRKEGVLLNVQN